MTFSKPAAHLPPSFLDLKLINLDDLHQHLLLFLSMKSTKTSTSPIHILLIILPKLHTYTRITPEVLQEVTFIW